MITWNDKRYKLDTVTAEFWPDAVFVLGYDGEEGLHFFSDRKQLGTNSGSADNSGAHVADDRETTLDVAADGQNLDQRSWSLVEALQFIVEHPGDTLATQLIERLVHYFFLVPVAASGERRSDAE